MTHSIIHRVRDHVTRVKTKARPPFEPDDIVRLHNGSAPQMILEVAYDGSVWFVKAQYLTSLIREEVEGGEPLYDTVWRLAEDYIKLDPSERETDRYVQRYLHFLNQAKEANMAKLYQTKEDTPRFGTFLATNSQNKIVLEMKGSGTVEAFDPEQVEVVRPYTVKLSYLSGIPGSKTKSVDFIAVKGSVQADDLVVDLNSGLVAIVSAVDTKATRPGLQVLKACRIVTEKVPVAKILDGGDEDDFLD